MLLLLLLFCSNYNNLLSVVDRYGKIVGFYVGKEPGVILADFELIKNVYKRDDVAARPDMKPFCDFRPGHWVLDKENEGKVKLMKTD